MGRPPREVVDLALERVAMHEVLENWVVRDVLVAEVRALQDELAALEPEGFALVPVPADAPPEFILQQYPHNLQELARLRAQVARLQATITRVGALPAKWRNDLADLKPEKRALMFEAGMLLGIATREYVAELEAALKPCASNGPDTAPISAPDGHTT